MPVVLSNKEWNKEYAETWSRMLKNNDILFRPPKHQVAARGEYGVYMHNLVVEDMKKRGRLQSSPGLVVDPYASSESSDGSSDLKSPPDLDTDSEYSDDDSSISSNEQMDDTVRSPLSSPLGVLPLHLASDSSSAVNSKKEPSSDFPPFLRINTDAAPDGENVLLTFMMSSNLDTSNIISSGDGTRVRRESQVLRDAINKANKEELERKKAAKSKAPKEDGSEEKETPDEETEEPNESKKGKNKKKEKKEKKKEKKKEAAPKGAPPKGAPPKEAPPKEAPPKDAPKTPPHTRAEAKKELAVFGDDDDGEMQAIKEVSAKDAVEALAMMDDSSHVGAAVSQLKYQIHITNNMVHPNSGVFSLDHPGRLFTTTGSDSTPVTPKYVSKIQLVHLAAPYPSDLANGPLATEENQGPGALYPMWLIPTEPDFRCVSRAIMHGLMPDKLVYKTSPGNGQWMTGRLATTGLDPTDKIRVQEFRKKLGDKLTADTLLGTIVPGKLN